MCDDAPRISFKPILDAQDAIDSVIASAQERAGEDADDYVDDVQSITRVQERALTAALTSAYLSWERDCGLRARFTVKPKKYLCIRPFTVDKYDDDGRIIDGATHEVEVGSVWRLRNPFLLGGEVCLESETDWIEITEDRLVAFFKELPDDVSEEE